MLRISRIGFMIVLVLVFFNRMQFGDQGSKSPFTISHAYQIKGISNLNLSPDGQKLLFSVTGYEIEKGKKNSEIYLLDLKTDNLTRLSFHERSDSDPFWSSDGKRIYFLSTRNHESQIWELDPGGGEARQISDIFTGVSAPVMSRQNEKIFFTSSVFPECLSDSAGNRKLSSLLEKGAVQAHLADSLLYRHWNAYREWRYSHLFYLNLADGKIQTVTSGKTDFPVFSVSGGAGYSISPDGKEICVTANQDENLAGSTNSDLFLIDLNTKSFPLRNLTPMNPAYDGSPAYSPNGGYIAYRSQKIPGFEADRFRLAIYFRKTGKFACLTENIDNWVQEFHWSHDSRYIYFSITEKARNPVYRIHIQSGKLERILIGHSIREFIVSPDGQTIIFLKSRVNLPVEIWSYRIGKPGSLKRLTFFHQSLEQDVDIRPVEEHWVTGADGHPVHLFVVKPHGFDPNQKYPLIINIHGGPQMMWGDAFRYDWQIYPGSGYVVAFPNPHGSTGYGQEFTASISTDWNGKVMQDIDRVTDYLASLDYVDKNRMGAMGWSWGGYAVMWLEGNSNKYKALASMMGVYDLAAMFSATEELWFPEWDLGGTPWDQVKRYGEQSPSAYVKNFKTPCLIITGERDYRVPYTQSLQFFTDLQKMGVPSRLIVFKNDGHWPDHVKSMPVYYNAHLEWFHKYLGGNAAPYDTEKLVRNLQFDQSEVKE